ncbi:unnamed protein product [Neospora caninum Liverpool]|uniref:Rhoptry kinase family protein ROP32, putative n=1 Tax=Neospora caninum (strain Liverpool) TaxID=572307 RepID=F0VJ94_NEOCL|nr:uncharacterized protein NCLIV_035860 [Neospora caninum Liverpool]CBZ53805.1 unnamed protein product [Neospora caninum Liverpool]CEL67799.1 TPA: Rhoptry kinase family protein ROP32, putative [Neospora caninum Liverpool]|eukprot:XP_003883837.1 uncharacterized protein NCLIV_035860 [Neospora caninum Liverpool]
MYISRTLLTNTAVWASGGSPTRRRVSHSSPSVFRPYTEIDSPGSFESVDSHSESNVDLTGADKLSPAAASEEPLSSTLRHRQRAVTTKSPGLRSASNSPSRHTINPNHTVRDPDRYLLRSGLVNVDGDAAERLDREEDLPGEDSQSEGRGARDDELVSEHQRSAEYPEQATESLSDSEAVKTLVEMVATTNTHDIVSHSRKKDLVDAFNVYLPVGERFFVESLSDASEPREFVRGPLLGVGGNGLVFEARDTDGHVYALKLLLIRMNSFLEAVGDMGEEAWRREEEWVFSRALRKEMKILSFFPPDKTPEQLYEEGFVLPLFQGVLAGKPRVTPLTDDFGATGVVVGFHKVACSVGQLFGAHCLPDRVKLELTKQMVDRVAHLHSYGILHGDVKWENFFLDRNGRVFLGDFEQSQLFGHGQTAPCGPRGGGTPSLHEPARAACYFADPDRRLDLLASRDSWCLGVVFFKLWCHRLPFGLQLSRSDMPRFMNQLATIERDGLVPDFASCRGTEHMPEDVKDLITALLYYDRYSREAPLSLVEKSPLFHRVPREKNDVDVDLGVHGNLVTATSSPASETQPEALSR